MFWDERGWFLTDYELEEEFNELKEKGETDAETYTDYVRNCTSKNGTLRQCDNMFCRNCISELDSRGEKYWEGDTVYANDLETKDKDEDGNNVLICDWCEESDYELTEIRFD